MNSKGRSKEDVTIVRYSAQLRSRQRPTPSTLKSAAYRSDTNPSCRQRNAGMPLTAANASRTKCSENPCGKVSAQACMAASTCGFVKRHATTADSTDSCLLYTSDAAD